MANSSRGVMKLTADNLESYQPITKQTETAGVPYETIASLKGVQHLDKYDDANALVLMGEAAFARSAHGAAAVVLAALLLLAAIQLDGGVFRVTGWEAAAEPPAGWSSVFSVYAGARRQRHSSAAGHVQPWNPASLVFRPRFPLSPGMHVRAVFQPPDGERVESTFDIPAAAPLTATTRVAQVYPTSGVLPANALKLYIYFSAPMRKGDSWKHLHLLRDGVPVEYPFLELDQELWDRDQRRFTVLFDPGRIKRGLASLAEAGPALEEGHNVHPGDRSRLAGRPRRPAGRRVPQEVPRRRRRPRAARPEELARHRPARGHCRSRW